MNRERQARAAERLEELALVCDEAVAVLREGQTDFLAYAMLYLLRRELGYVVRDMGLTGVPKQEDLTWARRKLGLEEG